MSNRNEPVPDNRKPLLGVIYTDGDQTSLESRSLAFFLAASLVETGYAKVNLVGLRPDGAPCDLQSQHKSLFKGSISYLPTGKSAINDVHTVSVAVNNGSSNATSSSSSGSEPLIRFSHWNDLQYCQVIIVVVNSDDTDVCCAKLATVLPESLFHVVVFSLQRGVKNGGILKDGFVICLH